MDLLSRLFIFFPYERKQEVHKCIHPKYFRVSGITISNVVTKAVSVKSGTGTGVGVGVGVRVTFLHFLSFFLSFNPNSDFSQFASAVY